MAHDRLTRKTNSSHFAARRAGLSRASRTAKLTPVNRQVQGAANNGAEAKCWMAMRNQDT
jgi:hypothetical protein